jgi:uncharacterized protein YkwD
MFDLPPKTKKKKKTRRRLPILPIVALVVIGGAVILLVGTRESVPLFSSSANPALASPGATRVLVTFMPTPLQIVTQVPTAPPTSISLQLAEAQAILAEMNAAREVGGAGALELNTALMLAALHHSQDMAAGEFMSHTGSDGSDAAQRAERVNYVYRALGENVLYRFDQNAGGAFKQWWDSPPHQENMLNPDFTEVGIAFAVGSDGNYYYTMLLGTPF